VKWLFGRIQSSLTGWSSRHILERRREFGSDLLKIQLVCSGPSSDEQIETAVGTGKGWENRGAPDLSDTSLEAIPFNDAATVLRDDRPETGVIGWGRVGKQIEVRGSPTLATPKNRTDLGPAPDPATPRKAVATGHARVGACQRERHGSLRPDGHHQPATAAAAAARQGLASSFIGHASTEPVLVLPLPIAGPISGLHRIPPINGGLPVESRKTKVELGKVPS